MIIPTLVRMKWHLKKKKGMRILMRAVNSLLSALNKHQGFKSERPLIDT